MKGEKKVTLIIEVKYAGTPSRHNTRTPNRSRISERPLLNSGGRPKEKCFFILFLTERMEGRNFRKSEFCGHNYEDIGQFQVDESYEEILCHFQKNSKVTRFLLFAKTRCHWSGLACPKFNISISTRSPHTDHHSISFELRVLHRPR